jgi:serine-aspartate repeat-containing protein C/D/E
VIPRRRPTRRTRSNRPARAIPCATALEPRRLLSVVVHDEGVPLPAEPSLSPFLHTLDFSGGSADGVELWEHGGTPGTARPAADAVPGPGSSSPRDMARLRNPQLSSYSDLYFAGDDGTGSGALYRFDGYLRAVSLVRRFAAIDQLTAINDTTLLFSADGNDGAGRELWKTNGTPAGTVRISDIVPGPAGASIAGITAFRGGAIFSADDGALGAEPWSTDVNIANAVLVKDINPGAPGSFPRDFLQGRVALNFNATTADRGSELWGTDGSTGGTLLAHEARPGAEGSGLTPLLPYDTASLYSYSYTRGDAPLEIYKTDYIGQTTLLKRISDQPAGERPMRAAYLRRPDGTATGVFVFGAADGATGLEPWRSDGTADGTYLLKDINPGPDGSLDSEGTIASVDNYRAFFAASADPGSPVLWSTTGTAAGTQAATGVDGRLAYNPTHLTAVERSAFFAASASPDANAPRTLWLAEQTERAAVTGRVFHDRDAGGVRDPSDVPVAGATVYADLDDDGTVDPGEPATVTGHDGTYTLTLESGAFTLRVSTAAPGYVVSTPAGGSHRLAVVFTQVDGYSFGVYTTGVAEVTAYNDQDGNGTRASYESVLPGRTIYNDANRNDRVDPGEQSAVTGPDGVARFEGLRPGEYAFNQVVPPGWTESGQSGANATVRSAGVGTADLGSRQPTGTGTLTGTVYDDANANRLRDAGEIGLPGRTVYIDADHDGMFDEGEVATTSDASGVYTLTAPAPGRYYLRQVVPADRTRTAPTWGSNDGAWLVRLSAGGHVAGLDFGTIHAPPASISGEAFNDLDADGVRDPGEAALGGGTAFIDLDNNGHRGDQDYAAPVDDSGRFTLTNLPPGTYLVRYTPPPDHLQTAPGRDERGQTLAQAVAVGAGEDATGVTFGGVARSAVASVFGDVFNDNNGNGVRDAGDPIASGRVAYIDADNDGVLDPGERRHVTQNNAFVFEALAPGTYTIRVVTPDGYRQTLPQTGDGAYTVTLAAGQRNSTLNFGFAPPATPSAITGTFYSDNNGNGRRDGTEGTRSGRVYLDLNNDGVRQTAEPTVLTPTSGFYSFTGLAAGTYSVRAEHSAASGTTPTQPWAGAYTVPLGANRLATGHDFGFIATSELGRISGSVFNDTNGNGTRDAGEAAPAGRTVWVDADDDGLIDPGERTATQGTDGYIITDVLPGTHTVRVVVPPRMMQTAPAGGAGRVVNVAVRQSVSAGSFGLAVGPSDSTPPAVVSVVVRGSAWSPQFTSAFAPRGLGDGGYAVPDSGTPRTLPWANADTIVVRFSEDVRLQRGDLRVIGAGGIAYAWRDFRYDPATFTATWTLAQPFGADRIRLELEGDAPAGVTDAVGNFLFGAAGGTTAGDAVRTFNTLPGDATGDGRTNALDLAFVKRRLNRSAASGAAYSLFADLTGDGRTNALDLAVLRRHLNRRLPPASATAALFSPEAM